MNKNIFKKFIQSINAIDIVLFSLAIIANIVPIFILKEFNIFPFVMNIISIIGVILASKGNYLYTFFSITYQIIYIGISFNSGVFGDAIITLLYYIPMLIYTAIFWKKTHSSTSELEVSVRKLSKSNWFIVILSTILLTLIGYVLLILANSEYALIDAITSALFIVSAFIGAKAFAEQWLFWALLNGLELTMWVIVFSDKITYDTLITAIMICLHFINSIYGLINWHRLQRKQSLQIRK